MGGGSVGGAVGGGVACGVITGVGEGGVGEGPLDTLSVMAVPAGTWSPDAGVVLTTSPAGMFWSATWTTGPGTRPV